MATRSNLHSQNLNSLEAGEAHEQIHWLTDAPPENSFGRSLAFLMGGVMLVGIPGFTFLVAVLFGVFIPLFLIAVPLIAGSVLALIGGVAIGDLFRSGAAVGTSVAAVHIRRSDNATTIALGSIRSIATSRFFFGVSALVIVESSGIKHRIAGVDSASSRSLAVWLQNARATQEVAAEPPRRTITQGESMPSAPVGPQPVEERLMQKEQRGRPGEGSWLSLLPDGRVILDADEESKDAEKPQELVWINWDRSDRWFGIAVVYSLPAAFIFSAAIGALIVSARYSFLPTAAYFLMFLALFGAAGLALLADYLPDLRGEVAHSSLALSTNYVDKAKVLEVVESSVILSGGKIVRRNNYGSFDNYVTAEGVEINIWPPEGESQNWCLSVGVKGKKKYGAFCMLKGAILVTADAPSIRGLAPSDLVESGRRSGFGPAP